MKWLAPWWSTAEQSEHFHETFAAQLRLEICADDPIYCVPAKIIGRGEGDDALFQMLDGTDRVAFVHLKWGKLPGQIDDKFRTRSKVYESLQAFFEQHLFPEHTEWVGDHPDDIPIDCDAAQADPERCIEDLTLGLACHIYGQAPVQADGRVRSAPFYFRSRHAGWTFTVCVSHDIDASAIDPREDKPGFFQMDEYRGYYLSGDCGEEHEASFMRYDEAERIIRECVQQYLRAAAELA